LSSLHIFDISLLLDLKLLKIFSKSVGCHFVLLTLSFALQNLCYFMRSHLLILDFTAKTIAVLFRNYFPVPISSRLSPLSLL
jgi:predicted membrane-bound mannosyltransferase